MMGRSGGGRRLSDLNSFGLPGYSLAAGLSPDLIWPKSASSGTSIESSLPKPWDFVAADMTITVHDKILVMRPFLSCSC
jgi:hypothetical protein